MPRRASGGLFGSILGNSKPVVANLRMASYTVNRAGKFNITLGDGQVWEQLPGDLNEVKWKKPASSYVVSVYEGALGTYNLRVSGDSHSYKARRVR